MSRKILLEIILEAWKYIDRKTFRMFILNIIIICVHVHMFKIQVKIILNKLMQSMSCWSDVALMQHDISFARSLDFFQSIYCVMTRLKMEYRKNMSRLTYYVSDEYSVSTFACLSGNCTHLHRGGKKNAKSRSTL